MIAQYKLRWRFDYLSRPSKAGMWALTTNNPVDCAWSQPKDGLVRASIEGKNIKTKEIEVLAESRGQDFRVFQWLATALCPIFHNGDSVLRSTLVGLKLLTSDDEVSVMCDGSVHRQSLSEQLKTVNFKTY
jgi:hypothetical protein